MIFYYLTLKCNRIFLLYSFCFETLSTLYGDDYNISFFKTRNDAFCVLKRKKNVSGYYPVNEVCMNVITTNYACNQGVINMFF